MSEQQQSWGRAAHRSGVRKNHDCRWRHLMRRSLPRRAPGGACKGIRKGRPRGARRRQKSVDLVSASRPTATASRSVGRLIGWHSCCGVTKTPGREESHQACFPVAGESSSPQRGVPSSLTTGSHASRWQAQHESEVVPAVCCVAQLTVKRRLMSCVRSSFQQLMQIDDLRSMSGAACSATNSRLPQRG